MRLFLSKSRLSMLYCYAELLVAMFVLLECLGLMMTFDKFFPSWPETRMTCSITTTNVLKQYEWRASI